MSYEYPSETQRIARRGNISTTYSYDAQRGWLSSVAGSNGTIQYDYDSSGNRTSVTASGGETRYSYDALGRLAGVWDKPAGQSTFTHLAQYHYDAVGSLAKPKSTTGRRCFRRRATSMTGRSDWKR